jgi:hypothetical protein
MARQVDQVFGENPQCVVEARGFGIDEGEFDAWVKRITRFTDERSLETGFRATFDRRAAATKSPRRDGEIKDHYLLVPAPDFERVVGGGTEDGTMPEIT